jgi:hypothetical protein
LFLNVIIHVHLLAVQNNKTSFEKLIQSMRDRDPGKKTVVKRKLILSDEEDVSEDDNEEARVQQVSEQKFTMENRINTVGEEDTVEKRCGLYETCGSMSPIIEHVSDDDKASDETINMNYEADTDESPSPVLGRNMVTDCSRMETERYYEGELSDMSVKRMSRSRTKNCVSAAQQSKTVEMDQNSEKGSKQTINVLSQHTQANVNPFRIFSVCTFY